MAKRITFDAEINANNMITIPYATRIKHDLEPGDVLTFEIVSTKKRLAKKEAKA